MANVMRRCQCGGVITPNNNNECVCQEKFCRENELRNHFRNCDSMSELIANCNAIEVRTQNECFCGETFDSELDYLNHINICDYMKTLLKKCDEIDINHILEPQDDCAKIVSEAFGKNVLVYRIENNEENELDISSFLNKNKTNIGKLIENYLKVKINAKVQLTLKCTYEKFNEIDQNSVSSEMWYDHKFETVNKDCYSENCVSNCFTKILKTVEEKPMEGSGFTLSSIDYIDIKLVKVVLVGGGCFLEVPDFIKKKNAIYNPQNNDTMCFAHCVRASIKWKKTKKKYTGHENQL